MAEQKTAEVLKGGPAQVSELGVGGLVPVGTQSAITAPTGGATVDAEARTAINAVITLLEAFGLATPN
jgi:hypothetical protein